MKYNGDYQKYLQSKHWKDLAEETRRLAGYRCQVCNSEERLEVHHRTYERRGDEHQSDLVCLCHECHAKFHGKEEDPYKEYIELMRDCKPGAMFQYATWDLLWAVHAILVWYSDNEELVHDFFGLLNDLFYFNPIMEYENMDAPNHYYPEYTRVMGELEHG